MAHRSAAPYIKTGPNLSHWPAGPMARRLTTNQEIAGSIPASVNLFAFVAFYNVTIDLHHARICITVPSPPTPGTFI
ncbi:hypothetical protein ACN42_g5185 [Penicillium freii]|uniref:Uncharacterized protein n=1 Tax=Penicillium freii TaxID=48697 RepID=A0A101MJZ5_PENFR|nr:hypothetical protein ACN42_g5185 [Penicillium freii]